MITCPSCNAQLPDDTIHCGECGHKVEPGSGMKTMFGMAALSPENMAQAAEEAKAARIAAEEAVGNVADNVAADVAAASEAVTGASATIDAAPKLKLPSPGAPAPGLAEESSSVFDLPKPGGADHDPRTVPVSAPGFQQQGPAPTFGTPEPTPEDFPGEDTGPSAFGSDFAPVDESGTTGPTAFADTAPPGQSTFPNPQPQNTSLASGPTGELDPAPGFGSTEEAPKSKTVLYVVGAIVIAMTLCCIVSAILQFVVLA